MTLKGGKTLVLLHKMKAQNRALYNTHQSYFL